MATRANQKLAFRYFGPYQVLQRIGVVAYKLKLPDSSMVHPVFHVSQLRQALPPTELVQEQLLAAAAASPTPDEVLEQRVIQRGNSMVPQVLVRWTDQPPEFATWEDREELQQHFPKAPAWGQAASQGGGDVTLPPADASKGQPTGTLAGPERPRRPTQTNSRYAAHIWDTTGQVKKKRNPPA